MTQVFGYRNRKVVLLATDSLALFFDRDGECRREKVRKVIRLSPTCVMFAAGSGIGLVMARDLAVYVRRRGLWGVDDVAAVALPFVRAAFSQSWMDQSVRPELERFYIIVAGLAGQTPGPRLHLLGVDEPGQPVRRLPVGSTLAIPRHLGFEMRMSRVDSGRESAEWVEGMMEAFLRRMKSEGKDVDGPFVFLRVDENGIRERVVECLDSSGP